MKGIYLARTNVDDVPGAFESGGRPKQMDYMCGHG
jgi:hypothetical protein